VQPVIRVRNKAHAERLLEDLVEESVQQRRAGLVPALANAPHIRYVRHAGEQWRTALDTFQNGHGDCDNLSVWLAADCVYRGVPARVVLRHVGPRQWHAVVELVGRSGRKGIADPSKARGM
jgi:hypothetical protein